MNTIAMMVDEFKMLKTELSDHEKSKLIPYAFFFPMYTALVTLSYGTFNDNAWIQMILISVVSTFINRYIYSLYISHCISVTKIGTYLYWLEKFINSKIRALDKDKKDNFNVLSWEIYCRTRETSRMQVLVNSKGNDKRRFKYRYSTIFSIVITLELANTLMSFYILRSLFCSTSNLIIIILLIILIAILLLLLINYYIEIANKIKILNISMKSQLFKDVFTQIKKSDNPPFINI